MQTLSGKRILLGITGGIAAYKCAELARTLIELGADIRVVMTQTATKFITPLTMQTISGYPISFSCSGKKYSMKHIELAKWPDLILLVPATANLIANMRVGIANDLLSTLILATNTPISIAPAMNQNMYLNRATQENLTILAERGINIWGPKSGKQACGNLGLGRMLEPIQLVERCEVFFQIKCLQGKSILISAGPTHEALDPVRYITNYSSGKMGYALAEAAKLFGAKVTLVSGPVSISKPKNITRISVKSALEMHQTILNHAIKHDVFISCAAVADYRPKTISSQKIKKTDNRTQMNIRLVKNPDIVADVGKLVKNRPFTVGFSAETQNIEKNTLDKLIKKNLDIICANNVACSNQGFNSDYNAITIYEKQKKTQLPLTSKTKLAKAILLYISECL
ncbi:coenzyme A biosynthesis bifunctional protein CoaBC [Candidatus Photodesmus katoptron]|uniref:Coenzyme A biosynthesis bifunctional protein CoaBC n=1 Tax=Candidatus Photodesmus katoptron Akat1 TaxID=1236703 RepID=S3DZ48_9GAMM|nr:bifunctional phosphopantothenoylcysteine decarboxylase/phosphopantothenate--cysteine ligase CoaBC [Candidatus Photodesmus katoptron]EPE37201.1 coenzyme A biosynthesis bifunctional protein CoaBC [Candidatus Photodesmus katoptron Akat1]KEY90144.1 coenzyme A biosynthesis bifunctional protein CoaBC [Candidatus Photodesmus katoptron]